MTIEAVYRQLAATQKGQTFLTLWAQSRRAEIRQENVLRLTRKRTRREALSRAASQMHIDDLDAALRDALRGDVGRALWRVADSVSVAPEPRSGTPWRLTGWLTGDSVITE
jgi:hypothetical protein